MRTFVLLLVANWVVYFPIMCANAADFLKPSDFSELPASVVKILDQRGCRIPQAAEQSGKHNAVVGSFADSSQRDYAALCERNGMVTIEFVWGGHQRCPELGDPSPMSASYQDLGHKSPSFSSLIASVSPTNLVRHGEQIVVPIDYDLIETIFVGKASTLHYCKTGSWVEILGAD